ncbi:hypothetical protein KC909_06310 [Candidatus Dojkabacteria bacterium]|uniref:Uncharacterized protein n=1 Tax=Candidatus Dojkabacteria bacterium TaxID=2099670 RepID=A0A955L6S2_9BACT|nr:hypothetical protein [Candidatus Dojkabacteria bacterium]
MIKIIYSSQARNDLAHINWKIREKIVTFIGDLKQSRLNNKVQPIQDSDLLKISIENHVVIGEMDKESLNIIKVVKRPKIKLPEYEA